MSKVNKFIKGSPYGDFGLFVESLMEDDLWVYLDDRPKHPAFIANMSLARLWTLFRGGHFYRALHNPEYKGD